MNTNFHCGLNRTFLSGIYLFFVMVPVMQSTAAVFTTGDAERKFEAMSGLGYDVQTRLGADDVSLYSDPFDNPAVFLGSVTATDTDPNTNYTAGASGEFSLNENGVFGRASTSATGLGAAQAHLAGVFTANYSCDGHAFWAGNKSEVGVGQTNLLFSITDTTSDSQLVFETDPTAFEEVLEWNFDLLEGHTYSVVAHVDSLSVDGSYAEGGDIFGFYEKLDSFRQGSSALQTVPEPSSAILLIPGIVLSLRRRHIH